jgi:lysophospholipase L1-like esterase
MLFPHKGFSTLALPATLLLVAACNTSSVRKAGAAGTDYFETSFKCKHGLIKGESDPRFLMAWQFFHEKYQSENKETSAPFAVLTGDSVAHLFLPERLKEFLPEFQIINRGIGGDSTLFLLRRLNDDVLVLKPEVVIISIGGNDILGGRCLDMVLENTAHITRNIRHSLPDTRIVLTSIPPTLSWKANSITPYYNAKLKAFAESQPGVFYVDLWSRLAEKDNPLLARQYHNYLNEKLDPIHFNAQGYAQWALLLRPLLLQFKNRAQR